MKINRIFLDMDGVLSKFDEGVAELCGKPGLQPSCWNDDEWTKGLGFETREELWDAIDEQGVTFWEGLDPYPWRDQLWNLATEFAEDVVIATAPSRSPAASAGKVSWIQKWKGRAFRDYVLIPRRKDLLASPGAVLIDDREQNVDMWRERSVPAILFPQPWNRGRNFVGNKMELVAMELNTIKLT